MSLKAKLEAVIYAAEEPVTLAQLAALFTADALEWKAEQEAASAGESPGTPKIAASSAETVSKSDSPANSEGGADLEAAAEAELEARRLARLRDREAGAVIAQLLDELIDDYVSDERGIEIREIAGGYRMATKPECHDAVRSFVKSLKPPLKLSLPALETLAVIAYKQPVTAPEVNEIRGVDSSAVFGSLLARKLITTAGRKPVIGRPILYKTTREFLLRFGLKDISELPSMEEFEKMAAIELDEPELSPGTEAEPSRAADLSLELDETAAEEVTDEILNAPPETP
ncbi:MAG: SMC-Scp complex subunit ScpB [Terracidiphilus sp.]|jgi:segregation and condensation protein B